MSKKTIVIGASLNPERYSHLAVERLVKYGHEVIAIGLKEGEISGVKIHTDHPLEKDVDTVTVYVNEKNLPTLYDYISSLRPRRIIFNPGAENENLERKFSEQGI